MIPRGMAREETETSGFTTPINRGDLGIVSQGYGSSTYANGFKAYGGRRDSRNQNRTLDHKLS